MKTMEKYEGMTNPQLLIEIKNRNTILKAFNQPAEDERLKKEIAYLWKLMERNGYIK